MDFVEISEILRGINNENMVDEEYAVQRNSMELGEIIEVCQDETDGQQPSTSTTINECEQPYTIYDMDIHQTVTEESTDVDIPRPMPSTSLNNSSTLNEAGEPVYVSAVPSTSFTDGQQPSSSTTVNQCEQPYAIYDMDIHQAVTEESTDVDIPRPMPSTSLNNSSTLNEAGEPVYVSAVPSTSFTDGQQPSSSTTVNQCEQPYAIYDMDIHQAVTEESTDVDIPRPMPTTSLNNSSTFNQARESVYDNAVPSTSLPDVRIDENLMIVIESSKGGKLLLKAGHRYRKNKQNSDGSSIWKCTSNNCSATISVDQNLKNILRSTNHTCLPDHKRNIFEKFFDDIKQQVKTNLRPIPALYDEGLSKLKCDDFADYLPHFKSRKSILYRLRNKALKSNRTTFSKLCDVKVPDSLAIDFLLEDDGVDDKIIIFVSNKVKAEINSFKNIVLDGTFKACSKPFKQLYSLHVDIAKENEDPNIVPVIFALLPDKKQTTYQRLFSIIRTKLPNFIPNKFYIDCEIAAINAITNIFPHASIKICFFHFCKNIWDKAKELSLTKSYEGRKYIKMCIALAHLPCEKIPNAWQFLLDYNNQYPTVDTIAFKKYMSSQWLTSNIKYISNYKERIRTTNHAEGWHSRLNKKIMKRPNLCLLISVLKEESSNSDLKLEQNRIGRINSPKRKIDFTNEPKITKVVDDYLKDKIDIHICLSRLGNIKILN